MLFLDEAFLYPIIFRKKEIDFQNPSGRGQAWQTNFSLWPLAKECCTTAFKEFPSLSTKFVTSRSWRKKLWSKAARSLQAGLVILALATSFFSSLWGWGSSYISDRLEDVVYAVVCHGRLWWGTFFGSAWPTQKREKICLWPHSELGCSPSQSVVSNVRLA